jgi:hypothetical protein
MSYFGSVEFLLSGDEIKSTGKMKEEAVPIPSRRSSAFSDDGVLPVQESSHLWGAQRSGGETPVVRSSFFRTFLKSCYFLIAITD